LQQSTGFIDLVDKRFAARNAAFVKVDEPL